MKVYELKIKVFTLKDIPYLENSIYITRFIDMCMNQIEKLAKYHDDRSYKAYTFDHLYPFQGNTNYKKEQIYTFRIRTIDSNLAEYFFQNLPKFMNEDMKGLIAEIRVLPKYLIEKLYTLTPTILKADGGYWKYSIGFEKFEERLKVNCIKKYKYFTNEEIDENIPIYLQLIFKNKKPVPFPYKNITLRGDKIEILIAPDKTSQRIAYMLLGIGLLENCSRGAGFLSYRYYKE